MADTEDHGDEATRLTMKIVVAKSGAHEVTHHKNGVRTDNRRENLETMTNAEHQRLHRKLERDKRNVTDAQ